MAQRKKSIGKQRATFSLFRQGNPAQKVGTFAFFGKSFKKASAAGSRYLRKLGLTKNLIGVSTPREVKIAKAHERKQRADYLRLARRVAREEKAAGRSSRRRGRFHNTRKRKKNLNFGQRMARLRARKRKR